MRVVHWSHRFDPDKPICQSQRGVYTPLQLTPVARNVTCKRCQLRIKFLTGINRGKLLQDPFAG
jgi:LSD1 subclass zinc finger protein